MTANLLYVLVLVSFGGALGGYLSGPLAAWGSRRGPNGERRDQRSKLERVQRLVRSIMAGVGGAIVAVAFAGGLVEYDQVVAANDPSKYVAGVVRLLLCPSWVGTWESA